MEPPDPHDELLFHVDGDLVPASEATVPIRDRGLRYGDAARERIRVYGGEPFRWEAHADRLAGACDALGIDHGLTRTDLRERVRETLAANELDDALVQLSITRGDDAGGLTPDDDIDPTVLVTVDPLPPGGREGTPVWHASATLQTVKTRRIPDRAVPVSSTTHTRLDAVLARRELRATDADEAMMLDAEGNVAGGADSSLFFVSDNALRAPQSDGHGPATVTREVILDLAESEGFPVGEGQYAPDDVRRADEVFLVNASWEVRPVATVDGIDVGRGTAEIGDKVHDEADDETSDETNDKVDDPYSRAGPLTTLLARLFGARVEQECLKGA